MWKFIINSLYYFSVCVPATSGGTVPVLKIMVTKDLHQVGWKIRVFACAENWKSLRDTFVFSNNICFQAS